MRPSESKHLEERFALQVFGLIPKSTCQNYEKYLHTLPVEPAGVAGRTLEERVAEERLDGIQADGAGLRQAEL